MQAVLKKAAGLDIQAVYPLHGPVVREDLGKFLSLYQSWSTYTPEEEGVVIAYTSVYGNTRKAALQLAELLQERAFHYTAWNKLYRRAFVEKYHLDFQTVRNGNDVYFTQCCVGLADRITTVDKALVNYRINQGTSLVDTVSKSPLTLFKAWIAVYETLSQYIQVPMRSYENKVVDIVNHTLLNIKDHFAYAEAFRFLKEEGIEKLHITAHEDPDYFYFPWQKGFVDHLLSDDLDTFKQYMLHATYRQVLDMELKLNALRNSNTFKVGDAIMRVPRDIKAFFKKS